jgi:hypothetical protein
MLQRIDAPDTVLAVKAVGKIETSDYDTVLEPAVEAMIAEHGKVRFVYVLGEEFDAYTAGASWEDAKLGISHASKWERIAVVTDTDALRHVVDVLGWLIPGEVKTFRLDAQARAIEWAAG